MRNESCANANKRLKQEQTSRIAAIDAIRTGVILLNSFGNLYRDSRLIFTKHPPDLAYLFSYLALACLLLGGYHLLRRYIPSPMQRVLPQQRQNALIFYVLHPKVLDTLYLVVEHITNRPFVLSMLLAVLSIPPLLLACLLYARLRQRHPTSILRYL